LQNKKGYKRTERVSRTLQRAVSDVLCQNLSDPGLKGVIVMSVDVSPDLKNASVYWYLATGSDPERIVLATKALERAVGRIRNRVAASVRMKMTPKLQFKYDSRIDNQRHIESLLSELVTEDQDS
jgi:ribosome-binding factor A